MIISAYTKNGIDNQDINLVEISQLSLINRPTYTTKGNFKTWHKIYKITFTNGNNIQCSKTSFDDIKQQLSPIDKQKETISQYKTTKLGIVERKAINWYYQYNIIA